MALHDRVPTLIDTQAPDESLRYPSHHDQQPSPFGEEALMGTRFSPDHKLAHLGGGTDEALIVPDPAGSRRIRPSPSTATSPAASTRTTLSTISSNDPSDDTSAAA
jgi:hypothetical protein